MGLLCFRIFISDVHSEIKCPCREFVDGTKMSGAVDVPGGRDAIQKDLDKLEQWALGQGSLRYQQAGG